MRDIIFRGKRIDNGEWIEGDLLQNVDAVKIREQEKTIKHCARSFSVFPESVGQYTGLKDRNGKKIFEGDVVEYCRTLQGKSYYITVEYDENYGEWNPFGTSDDASDNECVEVIGNIHDNPELLKDGE